MARPSGAYQAEYNRRTGLMSIASSRRRPAAVKTNFTQTNFWTLASAVRLEADNQAREMMGWRRFMG